MTRRALLVCPGRGSYNKACLGQLQDRSPAASVVVDACDAYRAERNLPTVRALDAADRFSAIKHVAGEHASLLTFACSLADAADLGSRYTTVAVAGNSMGFYTALAASGALSLADAIHLVDTMGRYQTKNVLGGQLLYPLANANWTPNTTYAASIDAAIAASNGEAFLSISLGSTAVLAGTDAGIRHLQAHLPPVERGSRTFPMKLPLHSAFHTPVMQPTSLRAQEELASLVFQPPIVPLTSGHGHRFQPGWANPEQIANYTLGAQITETYDFTQSIRAALRHTAPDVVIALGPGNALGGPLAAILVQEGWRGLETRADFEAMQATDEPVLLSFGVDSQRALLT